MVHEKIKRKVADDEMVKKRVRFDDASNPTLVSAIPSSAAIGTATTAKKRKESEDYKKVEREIKRALKEMDTEELEICLRSARSSR